MNLFSKSGESLKVNEDALKKISEIKGELAVVCIVGPYRGGKSSLLNHLGKLFAERNTQLSDTKLFPVGHTEEACTPGILIAEKIFKFKGRNSEDINVIFIDTEGLFSDKRNDVWDTKIFVISLLMSSVLLFNGFKNLNNNDLMRLSLVTTISNLIKMNHDKKSNDEAKLKSASPHFIWLVRDFNLKLESSPADYLDKFFRAEETTNKDESSEKRNEIKKSLRQSFKSINCALMRTPVGDTTIEGKSMEECLQMMDKIEISRLRKEYQQDLKNLMYTLVDSLEVKRIGECVCTGPLLATYLQEIVSAINTNRTVYLEDTVNAIFNMASQSSLKNAKTLFDSQARLVFDRNEPIKWNEFNLKMKEMSEKSRELIKSELSFHPSNTSKVLDEFEEYRRGQEAVYEKKNLELIEKKDMTSAYESWRREFNYVIETRHESVKDFDERLNKFKADFNRNSFDNSKNHLNDSFWEKFNKQYAECDIYKYREKIIKKMEEKAAAAVAAANAAAAAAKTAPQLPMPYNNGQSSNPNVIQYIILEGLPRDFDHLSLNDNAVGTFKSTGSANGRTVYKGPRGGLYYLNDSEKPAYISEDDVDFYDD